MPFGNVNIIILGDWAQLFPVKAEKNPLFFKNKKDKVVLRKVGESLYNKFKDCVNLTKIMRQNWTEPDRKIHSEEEYQKHLNQKGYVQMLSGIREVE